MVVYEKLLNSHTKYANLMEFSLPEEKNEGSITCESIKLYINLCNEMLNAKPIL